MISLSCKLTRGPFHLDAQFEANNGLVALYGPSGSGKSTILNLIAGIERPDSGTIAIDGETLVDTHRGIFTPPHRRRIGLVFQSGQLFPHLTVRRNLDYGLAFVASGITQLISLEAAVDLLGIGHLLDRMPQTLSGGEAQRVAIGRALLSSPRALLMDEPLASLDEERKSELLPFIERLARELTLPIVYVSHSAEEVARLATTVCRVSNGRIERQGPAADVLMPQSLAYEQHLGGLSLLEGTVAKHDHDHAVTIVSHPAGEIIVPGLLAARAGTRVQIAIRPANVALALAALDGISVRTTLEGVITQIEKGIGPYALITMWLKGGDALAAYITRLSVAELQLEAGMSVRCLVKSVSLNRP